MTQLISAQLHQLPIAVTTSSSTTLALPNTTQSSASLRVVNEGPNDAFISVGSGDQTATLPNATTTTTCCPVLAGTDMVFSIELAYDTNIAAITREGTATLVVSVGNGA